MIAQVTEADHSVSNVFNGHSPRRPYLEYVILYTADNGELAPLEVVARSYSEAVRSSFLRPEAIKAVCIKQYQAIQGQPAIYVECDEVVS
jgi:hypothetical protein